jgi:BirA family biotin operon repressor/biotin-[acetyl-CoA-carboxylase] ligase
VPLPLEDALSAELIRQAIAPSAQALLRELTVLDETDSTNACLARLPPARRHAHAALAESQTHGRGRRQRSWYPPADAIYQPAGADPAPPHLTTCCWWWGLRSRAEQAGLQNHGIKWPNDIPAGGSKRWRPSNASRRRGGRRDRHRSRAWTRRVCLPSHRSALTDLASQPPATNPG